MYDSIEEMVENSFKNFHTRGFTYLCLRRTPKLTQKIYMFEGDVSKLPEVVNPHDHRYDFETHVLSGVVENRFYDLKRSDRPTHFMRQWHTPLNGGTGFADEVTPCSLKVTESDKFTRRQSYFCEAEQLHTIQIHSSDTVLLLNQFEDKSLPHEPTNTFFETDEKPTLSGLYEKFTTDEIISTLKKLGINYA